MKTHRSCWLLSGGTRTAGDRAPSPHLWRRLYELSAARHCRDFFEEVEAKLDDDGGSRARRHGVAIRVAMRISVVGGSNQTSSRSRWIPTRPYALRSRLATVEFAEWQPEHSLLRMITQAELKEDWRPGDLLAEPFCVHVMRRQPNAAIHEHHFYQGC